MNKSTYAVGGLALLVLASFAFLLLTRVPNPPSTLPAAAPVTAAPASTPAIEAAAAASAVAQYPIEPTEAIDPVAAPRDLESALIDLFGRKSVLSLLQVDDFARRVVATVDNLGRSHAPPRLWPVNPAQGKFTVMRQGDADVIDSDNGLRYAPLVLLAESVDLRHVMALYVRFYPLFQRAYEELGFPQRHFNDRLVAILDQLLATPVVTAPIKVRLPVIRGPYQPVRPWVLYEFEDPALESLAAGQKVLLRIGPVNARRIKARLTELRRLVAAGAPPR